jgi:FkbM family methyltransferase
MSILKKFDNLSNQTFYFNPTPTAPALIDEIFLDNYTVFRNKLKFPAGSIILDIGANEGMFSILMAKSFPAAKIISLEPVKRTYKQLLDNIVLNHVNNIVTLNLGLAEESGTREIIVSNEYSGGSSTVITYNEQDHYKETISLISLDELFEKSKIKHCRLLKIDIEGMEYESLLVASGSLKLIDNVVGEIHINNRLQNLGYSVEGLVSHIKSHTNLLYYDRCKMAE